MNKTIGEKIKFLREKNNISQTDLAERLGFTKSAISKWENGKAEPDLHSFWKLTKIFNVEIGDLIDDETKAENVKSISQDWKRQTTDQKVARVHSYVGRFYFWIVFGLPPLSAVLLAATIFLTTIFVTGVALSTGGSIIAYIVHDLINGVTGLKVTRTIAMAASTPLIGFLFLALYYFSSQLFDIMLVFVLKFFWGIPVNRESKIFYASESLRKFLKKIATNKWFMILCAFLALVAIITFTILGVNIDSLSEWDNIMNMNFG